MRFGSYGALAQMPNTIWRNDTSGRLRYGDEDGAVHLVTQVKILINALVQNPACAPRTWSRSCTRDRAQPMPLPSSQAL